MPTSDQMAQTFKLPLLPGNSCGAELLRTNFRKTQHFNGGGDSTKLRKDIPVDFDTAAPVAQSPTGTMQSSDQTSTLQRQVLRYYGYFTEPVPESPVEAERVRKIVLCYFLEDDTISVSEPKQDNSGIPSQGILVKRHQIQGITFDHLSVGSDVQFYGRVYHLVDADPYTKTFLQSIGMETSDAGAYPTDSYTEKRNKPRSVKTESVVGTAGDANAQGVKIKLSKGEIRATKQFLKNDRQVLRFEAYWDDTSSLYGELRFFKLFYFLSDDTIEVTEKSSANSGRDPFPSFVRRQRCAKPKPSASGNKPGTVMNMSLTFDKTDSLDNVYTHADLRIGETLHLFGRAFTIYDCDAFSRRFLTERYRYTEAQLAPLVIERTKKKEYPRDPPPHTGFGSEEDSLESWKHLVVNAPKRNATKFLESNNEMLKFTIRLENCDPTDEIRRFVLTYYLIDGTISIFEPVKRNSGIIGGKFLQRQRAKNVATGEYFDASEFYVGSRHVVNGFKFYVESTDERTLRLIENRSEEYPVANIDAVVAKLQAMLLSGSTGLREKFTAVDRDGNGLLDYDEFCSLFEELGLPVNRHEVLTVMRYFDENGDGNISYTELASKILPANTARTLAVDRSGSWEDVHAQLQQDANFTTSRRARGDAAEEHKDATRAAYGARTLLECYKSRPHLFNTSFKFAMDRTMDNKVGSEEFAAVLQEKLNLVDTQSSGLSGSGRMTSEQLSALCARLFTRMTRRLDLNELMRLLNGTSNHTEQNLQTVMTKRASPYC